jgi:hypothetical protein
MRAKTLKLRRNTDSVRKNTYATSNVSDSPKDPEIQRSRTMEATPPGPQLLPTSVAAHGMPPPMDVNVNLHNANVGNYPSSAVIAMEQEPPTPPIIAPQFAQYGDPSHYSESFNHADYSQWEYDVTPYAYTVTNGASSHVQSQPVQNHLPDLDLSETVENQYLLWHT